jgi:hypothetical protein
MNDQPTNRRSILLQILVVLVLCLVVSAALYIAGVFEPPPGTRQVTVEVKSSGGFALITYNDSQMEIDDGKTVTTPWRRNVRLENGTSIILTAGNPTQSGTLSCQILLDGTVWKADSVKAPQDKVTCAGIVP